MVHIPTTERQHYNTTSKVNTLGAYAGALAGATDDYRKEFVKQQQIKVNTESTKMRVESDKFVQEWRLANQANPDNEDAKAQLQSGLQEIYSRYGNNIDPIAKMDWDVTVNKINSAYEMANNQWAINQRAENTKLDVADGMNANFELARSYGRSGNLAGALGDYARSYGEFKKYAEQNMGATEARKLLDNYDEDFLTSYLNGLAEVDANAAMETMKLPEVAKVFVGKDSEEMMTKIINKQIAKQNFAIKLAEYNNEIKLSDKLDEMDTLDALRLLEDNEGGVSTSYFKAKKKALMSKAGITAETQAATFTSILLEAGIAKQSDGKEGLLKNEAVLTRIEDEFAKGNLTLKDKKSLLRSITNQQVEDLPELIDDASTFSWFTPYDYTNANDDFVKSLGDSGVANTAMLEYFRTINKGDKEYNAKARKELAKTIIAKFKGESLNTLGTVAVGTIVDGYKYIGGNINDPKSWEKM